MKKHVIILTAAFLFLFNGCAEKQNSPVDSNNNQQPSSDVPIEVKALLDSYSSSEEINLSEILTTRPDFDVSNINDSIYDVYLVVFMWGKLLPLGPPVNASTVWDGSLSVNGPSIVKTLAPIDFERGQDSLVTEDVSSAENWGSTTSSGFDGLVFLVLHDKVTPTLVPQVLTFRTPPFSQQFNFEQLKNMYAFYPIDPVNSVAVFSHKIRLHNCREGYFRGVWHKSDTSDYNGRFEGLWMGKNDDTIGVLAGHFWKTEEGAQLLEGWVSGGVTGQVIAELHGHWFFDDYRMCPTCGAGHGQFKGRLKVLNSDEHGVFRGEFGDYSLPPNDRKMPLHGRWHLDCVNIVTDDLPPGN